VYPARFRRRRLSPSSAAHEGWRDGGVVCLLVWVRLDGDHDFPLNSDGHARAHRTKYNTVSYNVRKY
jgi:hypothetical protein